MNGHFVVTAAVVAVCIAIAGMVATAYTEEKRTVRYQTCVKYHSPKDCK